MNALLLQEFFKRLEYNETNLTFDGMKAGEKNAQQLMESLGSVETFFKNEDDNRYSHEEFKQFLNALQSQSNEEMYSKIIKFLRMENEQEAVEMLSNQTKQESLFVQNLENMKRMEEGL